MIYKLYNDFIYNAIENFNFNKGSNDSPVLT